MKKSVLIFICLFMSLGITSCHDDNDNDILGNCPPPPLEGLLIDGGQISDISLYCLENQHSTIGEMWYDYYKRVKTVPDYESFHLRLILNRTAGRYVTDDKEEMYQIGQYELEYEKEKSRFILDSYNNYKENHPGGLEWPTLFTAYVNGEVTITCDKVLFGKEPGEDLSPYFSVKSRTNCLPVGIENPKLLYDFGDEIPTEWSKLFVDGSWLQPEYRLVFAEQPDEKYEEITLSVSFPMIIENYRNIAVDKYRGKEGGTRRTEHVHKSECLIRFHWE